MFPQKLHLPPIEEKAKSKKAIKNSSNVHETTKKNTRSSSVSELPYQQLNDFLSHQHSRFSFDSPSDSSLNYEHFQADNGLKFKEKHFRSKLVSSQSKESNESGSNFIKTDISFSSVLSKAEETLNKSYAVLHQLHNQQTVNNQDKNCPFVKSSNALYAHKLQMLIRKQHFLILHSSSSHHLHELYSIANKLQSLHHHLQYHMPMHITQITNFSDMVSSDMKLFLNHLDRLKTFINEMFQFQEKVVNMQHLLQKIPNNFILQLKRNQDQIVNRLNHIMDLLRNLIFLFIEIIGLEEIELLKVYWQDIQIFIDIYHYILTSAKKCFHKNNFISSHCHHIKPNFQHLNMEDILHPLAKGRSFQIVKIIHFTLLLSSIHFSDTESSLNNAYFFNNTSVSSLTNSFFNEICDSLFQRDKPDSSNIVTKDCDTNDLESLFEKEKRAITYILNTFINSDKTNERFNYYKNKGNHLNHLQSSTDVYMNLLSQRSFELWESTLTSPSWFKGDNRNGSVCLWCFSTVSTLIEYCHISTRISEYNSPCDEASFLIFLESSLQYTNLWLHYHIYRSLTSWNIKEYLIITQVDLRNFLAVLKNYNFPHDCLYDGNHPSASFQSNIAWYALKKKWNNVNVLATFIQNLANSSIKKFHDATYSSALNGFASCMPDISVWRKKSNQLGKSLSQSTYVNEVIDDVLDPIFEVAHFLSVPDQISVLSITVKAFCEAWMTYICMKKIKFSIPGAQQLRVDFFHLINWMKNFPELSSEAVQSIFSLEILRRLHGSSLILLKQPDSHHIFKKSRVSPCNIAMDFNLDMKTSDNKTETCNEDFGSLGSLMDEDFVPNKEEWLSLRLKRNISECHCSFIC